MAATAKNRINAITAFIYIMLIAKLGINAQDLTRRQLKAGLLQLW